MKLRDGLDMHANFPLYLYKGISYEQIFMAALNIIILLYSLSKNIWLTILVNAYDFLIEEHLKIDKAFKELFQP